MVKERVSDALLIFVVPPSLEALFQRLKARATESADELELRQRNAAIELARQEDYDYVVVNETGQVERTAARIDEIIAERARAMRRSGGAPHSTGHRLAPEFRAGAPDVAVHAHRRPARGIAPAMLSPVLRLVSRARCDNGAMVTHPEQAAFDLVPDRGGRLVEVAIDAAGGARTRTYTYPCRPPSGTWFPARPCLVTFGKRQALGWCSAKPRPTPRRRASTTKPILERVRADGPLLPDLSIGLARWIAGHYLAPPSTVIRAMLPPGLLERLDLVAERTEDPEADDDGTTRRSGSRSSPLNLALGPKAVRL